MKKILHNIIDVKQPLSVYKGIDFYSWAGMPKYETPVSCHIRGHSVIVIWKERIDEIL